jgi:hypothetical protein
LDSADAAFKGASIKRHLLPLGTILALEVAISACGGTEAPTTTATPIATTAAIASPTYTSAPAATATPVVIVVTATPLPPTPEPPTATSAPQPVQGLGSDALVAALKAAGVQHIAEVQTYTASDDPNHLLGRPNQYTAKASWHDDRLPAPANPKQIEVSDGGGIEVWPDAAGAQKRMDYIQTIGKSLPMAVEYDYVKGPVLLRVSKDLTPDQAAEYKKALDSLPTP